MQPGWHLILRKFMTAACAVLVCGAHGTEAIPAISCQLVVALRAEVEIALHMRAAGRASSNLWLAQQKVKHGPNPARHYKANQHPEPRAHPPPRRVLADIANHQEVKRSHYSPGKVEVDAKTERRRRVVPLFRRNHPEVVLNQHKRNAGDNNRPHWNYAFVIVHGNRLWVAHRQSPLRRAFLNNKFKLTLILIDGEGKKEVAFAEAAVEFWSILSDSMLLARPASH
jgi:hypothetical protein